MLPVGTQGMLGGDLMGLQLLVPLSPLCGLRGGRMGEQSWGGTPSARWVPTFPVPPSSVVPGAGAAFTRAGGPESRAAPRADPLLGNKSPFMPE